MMKKVYMVLFVLLLVLVSCGRNKNKIHYQYELPDPAPVEADLFDIPVTINIQDSLVLQDGMGDIIEESYEGVLPAADGPGIRYDLDIWKQEKSEDGVYWLSTTYLGAAEEEDHSFITEGRLHLMDRIYHGENEVIYRLTPLDGSTPLYFVLDGGNLTMLDQLMGHISSETNLNYTLTKK